MARATKKSELSYSQMSGRVNELVRGIAHGIDVVGGETADIDRFRASPELQRLVGQVIVVSKGMSAEQLATALQKDWAMTLRTAAQPPPQARIVAEFTATVNRDDQNWTQQIEETQYYFVNPSLTVERFPLQGTGVAYEKFVDLDFSNWDYYLTTGEILAEAARLSCTRLDRAAGESSLNARPLGPQNRSVVCICTDEWTERGGGVVGYVFESADGRYLHVDRPGDYWNRGRCVFRFGARK